jgi:hypothetical protein
MCYRRAGVPLFVQRGGAGEETGPMSGVVAIEWVGIVVAVLAFGPQTNARHLCMVLIPALAAAALLTRPDLPVRKTPLVVGVVILLAGLDLPPRWLLDGAPMRMWRSVSGVSWCLLGMYVALLWVGLRAVTGATVLESGATHALGGMRFVPGLRAFRRRREQSAVGSVRP